MLTGRQIREARRLLAWERTTMARRIALPVTVIDRAEAEDGEANITVAQEIKIKGAFEKAGIEFTVEPPGARLQTRVP